MKANIDQRSYLILKSIIENYPVITGKEIEKQYNLSRKQLSYSMTIINNYLSIKGLEEIKRKNTGKFVVSEEVINDFKKNNDDQEESYIYSEKERIYLILLILFCNKEDLSVYDFTSILQVARTTFLSDLKKVKRNLETFNVSLQFDRKSGYKLIGNESSKREVMVYTLGKILSMENGEEILKREFKTDSELLDNIIKSIENVEEKLQIELTGKRVIELAYIFYFTKIRINSGNTLDILPKAFLNIIGTSEYTAILELCNEYGIKEKNERVFLTSQLQVASKVYFFYDEDEFYNKEIKSIANEIIENFQALSGITFIEYNELLKALIQHCIPAFYRIKYNYHIENSIVNMVLIKYGNLHKIVRKCIYPFDELLGKVVPDEELVYITLLFSAYLNREGMLDYIIRKRRAIVVCENGIVISRYLFVELKDLFPEIDFITTLSLRGFEKYNEEFDIVFSTTDLKTDKIQFTVRTFWDEGAKNIFRERVLQKIKCVATNRIKLEYIMKIISKYADIIDKDKLSNEISNYIEGITFRNNNIEKSEKESNKRSILLSDLLTESTVKIVNENLKWQEAIELASFPILNTHKIYPKYVQNMIQSIQEDKPFIMIADGLIIAHSNADENVLECAMSMIVLPERISINDYMYADIIVVLATPNNKVHLKALYKLIEVIESKDNLDKIRSAKDSKEIVELFK